MAQSLEEINDNAFYKALGLALTDRTETSVSSQMRPTSQMCWPSPGQPHGGVLFCQLDTTMATAVMTGAHLEAQCSTVDLSVQYLAPALGPVFHCLATVQRRGRRLTFIRGQIEDDNGETIAVAQGTFRVFLPKPAT